MLVYLFYIIIGFALLVLGAKWLVESSVRLSLRAGLSAGLVGATVVAFGTSAPELVVSITSAIKGGEAVKVAVGTIIGSNICNILLILGACGVISPLRANPSLLKWDGPWLLIATFALAAVIWIGGSGANVSGAVDVTAAVDPSRFTISAMEGGILLVLFAGFILTAIVRARRDRSSEPDLEIAAEIARAKTKSWIVDLLLLLLSFGLLAFGSDRLVEGAQGAAIELGVDPAIVGLTIVAFGTSFPELATSVVAARKGQADLSISNVTGSNIQNILLCLGSSALIFGVVWGGEMPVQELFATYDLAVMCAAALLLIAFLAFGRGIGRYRAVLFLASYAAFVVYLVNSGSERG